MPKPPPVPAILSIQSQVVAGHVGNAAAQPALQRLGFEVWALPTTILSNHPGHGRLRGRATDAGLLAELVLGLDEGGWLAHCAAVLTGYLGTAEAGAVALDAVARVRAARPGALVLVDPVMGDVPKGLYVRPELVAVFREDLVPRADIVTPNRFELEILADRPIASLGDALAAAKAVCARGPAIVLCTSLDRAERPAGTVETLLVAPEGAWIARTPMLAGAPNGSGDLLSALFLGRRLMGDGSVDAFARASSAVWRVLAASVAAGADELALVPALESLLDPRLDVEIEQVAAAGDAR
jgi:pyridoxine kinase